MTDKVQRFPIYLPKQRQGVLYVPAPMTMREYALLENQFNNTLSVVRDLWIVEEPQPAAESEKKQ